METTAAATAITTDISLVDFFTKNDPKETPILLKRLDLKKATTNEGLVWKKVKGKTLGSRKMFEKTNPTKFFLHAQKKGVSKTIESEDPATLLELVITKDIRMITWTIRDEKLIYHPHIAGITEYAMTAPHGRLAFTSELLSNFGLFSVFCALVSEKRQQQEYNDNDNSNSESEPVRVYGRKIKGKENLFLFVKFKRFTSRGKIAAVDVDGDTRKNNNNDDDDDDELNGGPTVADLMGVNSKAPALVGQRTLASIFIVKHAF